MSTACELSSGTPRIERVARYRTQSTRRSPLSHSFAISGELKNERLFAHIMFNAYWEPLDFELPVLAEGHRKTGGDGSTQH